MLRYPRLGRKCSGTIVPMIGSLMQDTDKFEDTVKNLLKTPPKPHKPAKAEKDGDGPKPAPCAESEELKS